MNGIDMIREYLQQNGYDGLVCDDDDCACSIEDLAPCVSNLGRGVFECRALFDCQPGYKVICDNHCSKNDYCLSNDKDEKCNTGDLEH